MSTIDTVNKALEVMKDHDWFWMMADYTHPAIENARGSMRCFVELVATIKDKVVRSAMRELWMATYENVQANLWVKNERANKVYAAKKAELMAIIYSAADCKKVPA